MDLYHECIHADFVDHFVECNIGYNVAEIFIHGSFCIDFQ